MCLLCHNFSVAETYDLRMEDLGKPAAERNKRRPQELRALIAKYQHSNPCQVARITLSILKEELRSLPN